MKRLVFLIFALWPINVLAEPLTGYHWQGDAAGLEPSRLLEVAKDESQPPYIRARASHALTAFPSDEVFSLYLSQMDSDTGHVRRRAVDNLCEAFAGTDRDLVSVLAPLVREADPNLRLRAGLCLKRLDSVVASELVDDYVDNAATDWEVRRMTP